MNLLMKIFHQHRDLIYWSLLLKIKTKSQNRKFKKKLFASGNISLSSPPSTVRVLEQDMLRTGQKIV